MDSSISADDLWPLILKLSHAERIRLAKLALRADVSDERDALTYQKLPPKPDEFPDEDDALSWDGEGWEEFDAPR